jgi:hypothetical protein
METWNQKISLWWMSGILLSVLIVVCVCEYCWLLL